MHLIQQMPFQSAQSPTAMFKPLRQQVFSSHIKKANALHWLFSSYSVILVYYPKSIIRVFDTVYEIAISTYFDCNQWLQNGNRNFFGQLKTLAAALFFVEKSVENVKNT